MQVAILGYGQQGISSLQYWQSNGHDVTVCDSNENLDIPEGVAAQLGGGYLAGLDRFDLIVRAPVIHPRTIIAANGASIVNKITSNTNEFMRVCPTKNIIGVTGTKGKGTTSTLITQMLEEAGHRVHLGGNIGTPPLDLLQAGIQAEDYVVLELANFQLIDLKSSPPIAVCVMVEPEHLDWHGDLDDYFEAKKQLFRWQTAADTAIYYAPNQHSRQIALVSAGRLVPYFAVPGAYVEGENIVIDGTTVCKLSDIGLLGDHNQQNVCAAVTAVWQVTQDVEAIVRAVRKLQSLPFRIERRAEINSVAFYNDSFAAAPGATVAAIKVLAQPKVMIIGGYDRNLPLDDLVQTVAAHGQDIRRVLLIGASAERVASELTSAGFTNFEISSDKNMDAIVKAARGYAEAGDAVVLSPGFPSFDMFKNFEVRGIAFNKAVEALA